MNWTDIFNNIGNVGKFLSPIATGLGAYGQYKIGKEQNNLLKSQYNRGIAKENKAQAELEAGFNSVYGEPKKKKQANTYADIYNYGV